MKQPIKIYSEDYIDTLSIMIFTIDKCNYNCSYCINDRPRTNKLLDLHQMLKFLDIIRNKSKFKIRLIMYGGEPILHPDILWFLKEVSNKNNVSVELLTNFSSDNTVYENIISTGCNLVISYHYRNDADRFINKLKTLNNGVFDKIDLIKIMLNPKYFNECIEVYKRVKDISPLLNVSANLLDDFNFSSHSNNIYSREQINEYSKLVNIHDVNDIIIEYNDGEKKKLSISDAKNNNLLSFKHWKCYAGQNFLYIDVNGNISKCVHSIPFGSIFSNDIKLTPTICTFETCPCGIEITKEKIFT